MSRRGVHPAEVRCAREGRAILAEALSALQHETAEARQDPAVERLAAASSLLFELESDAPPQSRAQVQIRAALEHLNQARELLERTPPKPSGDVALAAVHRTLALLYPLARGYQRERRRVIVEGLNESDSLPFASPEPLGPPPEPADFPGSNKRASGERIFLEVDIGLYSDSRFFTGLTRDLSDGGVFVATLEPREPGTRVALHFVLPSGRAVLAKGVVRWASRGGADLPPGIGVAFEELGADDLAAIRAFCEERAAIETGEG